MTAPSFLYGSIPTKGLSVSAYEMSARLQIARGYTNDRIEECRARLETVLRCKYAARCVPVTARSEVQNDEWVDLGFGKWPGHSICKALSGCSRAFVMAVTTGIEVDRLLARAAAVSPADGFILDALASAYAEAAADAAEAAIKGTLRCRPRFSPGYGDLPLSVQPAVLETVNAGRLLGITLNRSLLMTPVKSITAILGVYDETKSERTHP